MFTTAARNSKIGTDGTGGISSIIGVFRINGNGGCRGVLEGKMGIIRDIFEEKIEIWEGPDKELYDKVCRSLKDNGIKIQAFKVNQNKPKCDGDCASCVGAAPKCEEGIINYNALGAGCKDDILEKSRGYDIYAIYVKKSDVSRARELMA